MNNKFRNENLILEYKCVSLKKNKQGLALYWSFLLAQICWGGGVHLHWVKGLGGKLIFALFNRYVSQLINHNNNIVTATVPLWDRAQAGHDLHDNGAGHLPGQTGPGRLRARRGNQHLGHHRQPERRHHQGNQGLAHWGTCEESCKFSLNT